MGIRCADHMTPLYPQKLALTLPTGGGRSVGIVRLRTKATEFSFSLLTTHLGIKLVNDQLDAQFFYFMIHLLQSSTCFEQRRAHHQEVKLY